MTQKQKQWIGNKSILCCWREKLTYKQVGNKLYYNVVGDYDGYETKHFLPALKKIFKKVDFIPLEDISDNYLYQKLKEGKYDYFLMQIYHNEISPVTLEWIRDELPTVTIRFAGDDEHEWDCEDVWAGKKMSPCFNWNITTYKPELYSTKVVKTIWGANEELFKKQNIEKDIDVSFCGLANQDRPARYHYLNTHLKPQMIDLQVFGVGWQSLKISNDEYVKIFNRSKININFSRNEGKLQIKGRDFEVPMCGGFLITEYNPELEKYFKFGKEIETYKDNKELLDKIIYYTKHSEERKKIAEAGYKRAQKEHTYKQRFEDIFNKIEMEAFKEYEKGRVCN